MKNLIILLTTLASVSSYGQQTEKYHSGSYHVKQLNPGSFHSRHIDNFSDSAGGQLFNMLNGESTMAEKNHSPSFIGFIQPKTFTGISPSAGFYYSRNHLYLQAKGASRTLLWLTPVERLRPSSSVQAALTDPSGAKSDPTHSHSLDHLTNVNTKGKLSGDQLRWNAATGLWEKFTPDYLTTATGDARYPRFEHMHDASNITSGTFYSTRYGAGSIPTASIHAANGGMAGKILTYGNGWIDPNSLRVNAAGSTSQLQFNTGSAFDADNSLTFNTSAKLLSANLLSLNAGRSSEDPGAVLTIPTMQSFGNFRHTLSQLYMNGDGQRDAVYQWGYNHDGSGGRVNPAEAEFHTALESHYQRYGGADPEFEYHWETTTKDGSIKQRIFTMNISKTTGNAISSWQMDGTQWFPSGVERTTNPSPYMILNKSGALTLQGTSAGVTMFGNGANFVLAPVMDNSGTVEFVNNANQGTRSFSFNNSPVVFSSPIGFYGNNTPFTFNSTAAIAGNRTFAVQHLGADAMVVYNNKSVSFLGNIGVAGAIGTHMNVGGTGDLPVMVGNDGVFKVGVAGAGGSSQWTGTTSLYFGGPVTIGSATAVTDRALTLNSSKLTLLSFKRLDAEKAFLGIAGGADQVIASAASGDFTIRANTQKILFSADAGTTASLIIDTDNSIVGASTIKSNSGGFIFPDGTIQATAAKTGSSAMEQIFIIEDNLLLKNVNTPENALLEPVYLENNTNYLFEGQYIIHSQGNPQTTATGFELTAGASVISVDYAATISTTQVTHPGSSTTDIYVSGIAPRVLNTRSNAEYTIIKFQGVWKHKDAGEVMPQITLSAGAGGLNTLKTGSFIKFTPVNENRTTYF